jgi:hypothetical protein
MRPSIPTFNDVFLVYLKKQEPGMETKPNLLMPVEPLAPSSASGFGEADLFTKAHTQEVHPICVFMERMYLYHCVHQQGPFEHHAIGHMSDKLLVPGAPLSRSFSQHCRCIDNSKEVGVPWKIQKLRLV